MKVMGFGFSDFGLGGKPNYYHIIFTKEGETAWQTSQGAHCWFL